MSAANHSPSAIAVKAAIPRPDKTEMETHMNIGTFTKTEDGYTGTIRTLTVNTKAKFVPAEKKTENSPAFRIVANSLEIGAAWKKENTEDLSVILDDPSFPATIYPRLVAGKDDTFDLTWFRPKEK
jgi:uncharacterized protein (DUF736 family)